MTVCFSVSVIRDMVRPAWSRYASPHAKSSPKPVRVFRCRSRSSKNSFFRSTSHVLAAIHSGPLLRPGGKTLLSTCWPSMTTRASQQFPRLLSFVGIEELHHCAPAKPPASSKAFAAELEGYPPHGSAVKSQGSGDLVQRKHIISFPDRHGIHSCAGCPATSSRRLASRNTPAASPRPERPYPPR